MLAFFLEGIARKWILPSAQQPLFFLKDLALLAALIQSRHQMRMVGNASAMLFLVASGNIVFAALQVTLNKVPLLIGLSGMHADMLFPVGAYVSVLALRETLAKGALARGIRLLGLLLCVDVALILLQDVSPMSSFVNQIFADDGVGNLALAGDVVRATGTFTSSEGNVIALIASVGLGFWMLDNRDVPRRLANSIVLLASFGLILSGSRTAVIFLILACVVAVVPPPRRPQRGNFPARVVIRIGAIAALALIFFSSYFTALSDRFTSAAASENPFERYQHVLFSWVRLLGSSGAVGAGFGSASNAGIAIQQLTLTSWLESDYARYVHELGPVVGLGWVAARCVILAFIAKRGWVHWRDGHPGTAALSILCFTVVLTLGVSGQGDVALGAALLFAPLAQPLEKLQEHVTAVE